MSTYKRRDRKFEEHIAQLVDAKIPVKYHCVCRNYQGECEDECAEFEPATSRPGKLGLPSALPKRRSVGVCTTKQRMCERCDLGAIG